MQARDRKSRNEFDEVLDNICDVKFDGIPIPDFENTDTIDGLMKKYNIPGVGIVVIDDFKIKCIDCT